MTPSDWAALSAAGRAPLVGVGRGVHRRAAARAPTGVGDAAAATDDSHASDEVQCRNCGARNDAGYRYCRRCVSKLPRASSLGDGAVAPVGDDG